MKSLRRLGLAIMGLIVVAPTALQAETLAQSRAEHLRRGINIGSIGLKGSTECCSKDELNQLQKLGFDHVRVGVELEFVRSADNAVQNLDKLRPVLDLLTTNGMRVIVVVRLNRTEFDLSDAGFTKSLGDFWIHLSDQLAQLYPPEKVFLNLSTNHLVGLVGENT